MGNTNPTRRAVLRNGAGLVAGSAILAGTASASGKARSIDTGFDPHNFEQVDRFVNAVFDTDEDPYRLLEEWNETGEMDPIFSDLSEEQAEAFVDAIRPAYVAHERVGMAHSRTRPQGKIDASVPPGKILSEDPGAELRSYRIETRAIDEDPAEKWNWDKKAVRENASGRSGTPGRSGAPGSPPARDGVPAGRRAGASHSSSDGDTTYATTASVNYSASTSYSDTVHAYAASIDYTGYEWRGKIYWDYYYGGTVGNIETADTVLDTNYAVEHRGTDITVVDREEYFDAYFEAHFDNDLGEVCIEYYFGEYCVELKQSFHPYMELRGGGYGGGETIDLGNDSVWP